MNPNKPDICSTDRKLTTHGVGKECAVWQHTEQRVTEQGESLKPHKCHREQMSERKKGRRREKGKQATVQRWEKNLQDFVTDPS